jgi:hypothetical protein
VLLALGILPLLAGIGIEANNFRNAQQQVPNNDFVPKAWHNLESDQIFPDYLTNTSSPANTGGWSRQGIAREATCEEALLEDFKKAAQAAGCKTVLMATYVDSSGSIAATVGLVVLDSPENAETLGAQFSSTTDQGPLVHPVGFPKTAADDWVAVAGAAHYFHTEDVSPYLLAISIGTTEAPRSAGDLPEPWAYQERYENARWISIGAHLLRSFDGALNTAMREVP